MIDATVTVSCDFWDDVEADDSCAAKFEMSRSDVPADLRSIVEQQIRLRGWAGSLPGPLTCPLHNTESDK